MQQDWCLSNEIALVLALIPFRSPYPESCMVIPKKHIDHFTDIEDDLSAHIMIVAQKIGRNIREISKCERVGMVVHGYGVAHAHLNIFPQKNPNDITSRKFAYIENGSIKYGLKNIEQLSREQMDSIAVKLRTCI